MLSAAVGKKIESEPQLELNLNSFVNIRTAGDPDQPDFKSIDFSPAVISEELAAMGTPVSPPVIRGWLVKNGFALHKMAKVLAGGRSPFRNAQFEKINDFKHQYFQASNPVFSIDTKAKEFLGQFYRAGRVWTQKATRAFDHDCPSWTTGLVFRIFKEDLQSLVNSIGIEIRVAHYPSFCSKYNPIEHRFFPHVGRDCQGKLFDTLETVVQLMRRTTTRTGLKATVNVIRRTYDIGRKVAQNFKANMTILFDDLIPKWNYRVVPQ